MFGSVVLDVAIGMAFVYLLLSLIASVVQEIIAAYLQLRPANLLRAIRSLFSGSSMGGGELANCLYTHGLIRGLYSDPKLDRGFKLPAELAGTVEQTRKALEAMAATVSAREAHRVNAAANPANPQAQASMADADKAVTEAAALAEQWRTALAQARTALPPQPEASASTKPGLLRRMLERVAGFSEVAPLTGVSNQALLPAYIPSRTFALAMVDILNTQKKTGADAMTVIWDTLETEHLLTGDKAAEAMLALAVQANDDVTQFQKNLENWYSDSMDRASGWYKRHVQRILLGVGLILAMCFNVDSIRVARTLWFDRDSRQAMANAADEYVKAHPDPPPANGSAASAPANPADKASKPDELQSKLKESVAAFDQVTMSTLLPVGWKQAPIDYVNSGLKYLVHQPKDRDWVKTVARTTWRCLELMIGWLITGLAISLGAPFWFDTLNKFMVVRSTVKPQEKSQTEGTKDKAA